MFVACRISRTKISTTCLVPTRNYNGDPRVNVKGKQWREAHKLPAHINHHKSLMEGADFRFTDGRPTPYGVKQYQRMLEQQKIAEQVVELLGEMNFAVDRVKKIEHDKDQEIKNILNRKLKPKGGIIKV